MLKDGVFESGNVKLEYIEGPPSGPPLVFLPGGPSLIQNKYLPLVSALSHRWHVYAVNFRGTGKSMRGSGNYRLTDFTDDIAEFIGHLDDPPVVFGHSQGGMIAIGVGARMKDRLRALILGDPPLTNDALRARVDKIGFKGYLGSVADIIESGDPIREMAETLGDGTVTPANLWSARMFSDHDPAYYRLLCDRFDDFLDGSDLGASLAEITCPVLILQADTTGMGQAITDGDIEYAKSVLPDLTHVRLTGIDHGFDLEMWKMPLDLANEVMCYLEYIRP